MKYSFTREKTTIDEWFEILDQMEETCSLAIEDAFTQSELEEFFRNAIRDGMPLKTKPELLFWNFDDPKGMPSDARCDFIYRPTYLMVQTLIAGINRYPELFHVSGLRDTLERGLRGCTGRDLEGDGYDSYNELLRNLTMFLEAGTVEFLAAHPNLCPEFAKLFHRAVRRVRNDLKNQRIEGVWGEDYSPDMQNVVALYEEHTGKVENKQE